MIDKILFSIARSLCEGLMFGLFCFFSSSEPCQIEVRLLLAYNSNRSKATAKVPKSTWNESMEALPQPENGIEGTIPFSKPVKVYIMPKPARRWNLPLREIYLGGCWVENETHVLRSKAPNQNSVMLLENMSARKIKVLKNVGHCKKQIDWCRSYVGSWEVSRKCYFCIESTKSRQFSVSIPVITVLGQNSSRPLGFLLKPFTM